MTKKKLPKGRPTKYKPEYCEDIIEYFKQKTWIRTEEGKVIGAHFPTFSGYAVKIDVNRDTLNEWVKIHEDFSVAHKKAKELQRNTLINGALCGAYNNTFSIFLAKNITDLKDRVENHNYNHGDVDVPERESREEWEKRNGK